MCATVFRFLPAALLVLAQASFGANAQFAWKLPPGFPMPPVPADNPMSADKVELGRRLFYDTRLSVNGKGSCATCHQQAVGFTDQRPVAVGVTGEHHPRRAMALANVAYFAVFNWANPTVKSLEQQMLTPLFNNHPVELGLQRDNPEALRKLLSDPVYRQLFPKAFPGDAGPYTFDHITKAIAAFERTLISGNSPYDRYRYQHQPDAISASAKRGEDLFFHAPFHCSRCHGGITFGGSSAFDDDDPEFFNTGLYNLPGLFSFPKDNLGLYEFTHNLKDVGKFGPPSLRNVAVRAPYMHDGSISTLDGVLNHYAAGGRTIASGPYAGVGSKNPNRSDFVEGFTLTSQQRQDLLAFLASLTDTQFLQNPQFADPWK
ncbi:MAG TPA: di-heme enzyme [Bryobacteraceae bacterium]|nr:di-heme enzyme [Bryobacteraceae bacterium]